MKNNLLHVITDNRTNGLLELIEAAIAGGADVIQFRNKIANKKIIYSLAKIIFSYTRSKKIPLIMNDHVDIALAIGLDGVHIGQTDLPYFAARKILGKNKIIGVSIENIEQAKAYEHCDAHYFGVGPVFSTQTKSDVTPIGIDHFKKITEILQKPCIAIGGITVEQIKNLIQHGALGIAVVSGICDAQNPMRATQHYYRGLHE